MKKTSSLLALAWLALPASLAHASGSEYPSLAALPPELECVAVDHKNPEIQAFEIHELNTQKPWLSIDARAGDGVEVTGGYVLFTANNGCDNNYDVSFPYFGLEALKAGRARSVSGMLSFFNADLECGSKGCIDPAVAVIRCVIAKPLKLK